MFTQNPPSRQVGEIVRQMLLSLRRTIFAIKESFINFFVKTLAKSKPRPAGGKSDGVGEWGGGGTFSEALSFALFMGTSTNFRLHLLAAAEVRLCGCSCVCSCLFIPV